LLSSWTTRSSTGEVTEEERRSCRETRPTRPWTPLCSSSEKATALPGGDEGAEQSFLHGRLRGSVAQSLVVCSPQFSSKITLDAVSASQISHLLSVRRANVLLFRWLHSSLGFTNLQFTFPQSSSTCSVWQFLFDVTVSLSILTLASPAPSSTDTSVLML